jgi:hypothetical protein
LSVRCISEEGGHLILQPPAVLLGNPVPSRVNLGERAGYLGGGARSIGSGKKGSS